MPIWGGVFFQDSCSYAMEQLSFFHDHSMFVLFFVRFLVSYFIILNFFIGLFDRGISDGHEIEFFWTILPVFLLFFVAFPSLKILYLIDEEFEASLTYKVTGHQWYWSYDSYTSSILSGDYFMSLSDLFRLFEVRDLLFCPFNIPLRFLVTSQDVVHSWTIPSIGTKCDALPGRLNQLVFTVSRPGVYYGQCSELCGVNHSFMPISIESISSSDYFYWLVSYLGGRN